MLNKFDRPATMRTRETARATLENPLGEPQESGSVEESARAELDLVRKIFLACDRGEYRGPFEINSPFFFAICFETYDQREAFRRAIHLTSHSEQYWAGSAVDGTLGLLKTGGQGPSFAARPNPFAKAPPEQAKTAAKAENAEKYSNLRAEVKRTEEKLSLYADDRTWIAVCFPDEKNMDAFRKKWSLPEGKFIHVDDFVAALSAKGIKIDVPCVAFALRAEARPDKTLNALVG